MSKRGQKSLGENKQVMVPVYMPHELREESRAAARAEGLPVSIWMKRLALRALGKM